MYVKSTLDQVSFPYPEILVVVAVYQLSGDVPACIPIPERYVAVSLPVPVWAVGVGAGGRRVGDTGGRDDACPLTCGTYVMNFCTLYKT